MKKSIIIAMTIGLFGHQSYAQSYGTSLGIRLGNDVQHRAIGLSAQHRIMKGMTLEGIVQSDFNRNSTVHGLLKKHNRLLSKRFNYYFGTGISFGKEESQIKQPDTREITTTYGNPTLGVDLIFGLEVTLLKTNLSIDYKPNINLLGRSPWYGGQVGISARTVLVKG